MTITNLLASRARSASPEARLQAARLLVQLLNPFAPHVTEELWERMGGEQLLAGTPWPTVDESLLVEESMEVVVQVSGKVAEVLKLPLDTSQDVLEKLALELPSVQRRLHGAAPKRTIHVPGRLVNFVA